MYSIIQAPNEILRRPTERVSFSGPKLEKIVSEMKQILTSQKNPEGVGLAANQIGLPYSIFVTPTHVFINPEILSYSEELQPEKDEKAPLEGCLSLPKYYGIVKRYRWVVVKYLNEKLETIEEKFAGFPATVIQHEIDHLNGKIFVERILEQNGRLYKSTGKDKKDKDIWEEVEL